MANYLATYHLRIIGKRSDDIDKTFSADDDDKAKETAGEIRLKLYHALRKESRPYSEHASVDLLRLIEERPVKI